MPQGTQHINGGNENVKNNGTKKAEFIKLMDENSFSPNGELLYDGREVYSRSWVKEVEVVWHGKTESRLEIKIDEADSIPVVRIFKNGRLESRRGYTSPKRMINALREMVTYAGFEF